MVGDGYQLTHLGVLLVGLLDVLGLVEESEGDVLGLDDLLVEEPAQTQGDGLADAVADRVVGATESAQQAIRDAERRVYGEDEPQDGAGRWEWW